MVKQAHASLSLIVRANIRAEMVKLGFTQQDLAERIQLSRPCISRMLTGQRRITAEELVEIARALKRPVEWLAEQDLPNDQQQWNPRHDDCSIKLARFAEHEEQAADFITFDRFPAYSRMTLKVQSKLNMSRFGSLSRTTTNEVILDAHETWGHERLRRYLERDKASLPQVRTMMLRSDFERLFRRQWPFDLCTSEEIAECFGHLRKNCVIDRGFQLLLIEDSELDKYPDLRMQVEAGEALGVIGKHFTFRKLHDTSHVWSERADDVRAACALLKRLQKLAVYEPKYCLSEIEKYCRRLDDESRSPTSPSRPQVRTQSRFS